MLQICTHIYRSLRAGKWEKPRSKSIVGLLLAIMGVSLYTFVETEKNYKVRMFAMYFKIFFIIHFAKILSPFNSLQYIHSLWHIIMATSLIFLLPPKRATSSSNAAAASNDDCESRTKKHNGIPTFVIVDQEKIS